MGFCENARAISEASRDYGGIERRTPRAVLQPRSKEDISECIAMARRSGVRIAARGRGHCVRGQCLVEDGIVVDMTSLASVEAVSASSIDVQAGADWSSVLIHTLARGLWPPVLPNFLGLSVGGTLSVGGIGEATFRNGLICGAATSLEVVTGRGEILTCSADENAELFTGVQGGLGQFAIVVSARLSLVPAPKALRAFHLLYHEVKPFLEDFQRLARDEQSLRGLRGLVIPNQREYLQHFLGPAWISGWAAPERFRYLFLMTATFDVDESAVNQQDFLERTQHVPGAARIEELVGASMASSAEIDRTPMHPWVDLFIPGKQAEAFLPRALTTLPIESIGGPVLLYPILTGRTRASFCQLPEDEFVVLLSVSRAIDAELDGEKQQQELATAKAQNWELYETCRSIGGLSYPIGSLGLKPEHWKDHFGTHWGKVEDLKQRYDPDHLLAPGQQLFAH